MIERAARRSRELFDSGFYCAESVLLAIAEAEGVHAELIPRIATGFCSGMARTGGPCGALSGAIMGVSLFTGRDSARDSLEANYVQVRELRRMFAEKFGATGCGELLGLDLGTEEGQRLFQENQLHERCLEYTEEGTRMALRLLRDSGEHA